MLHQYNERKAKKEENNTVYRKENTLTRYMNFEIRFQFTYLKGY